jgi:hypothetical protein
MLGRNTSSGLYNKIYSKAVATETKLFFLLFGSNYTVERLDL